MIVCSSSVMAARGRGWAAGPGSITVARLSWPHFKYCVNNASAMFNRTTLIILVVALAAGLGLLASQKFFAGQAPAGPAMATVTLFPQPRELPAFSLRQSDGTRSEEHTSELQSLLRNSYAVFRLNKKKTYNKT